MVLIIIKIITFNRITILTTIVLQHFIELMNYLYLFDIVLLFGVATRRRTLGYIVRVLQMRDRSSWRVGNGKFISYSSTTYKYYVSTILLLTVLQMRGLKRQAHIPYWLLKGEIKRRQRRRKRRRGYFSTKES